MGRRADAVPGVARFAAEQALIFNLRNLLVVAAAIVLAVAVLLATGRPPFGRDAIDARFAEDHPFSSTPEFPTANQDDYAALRGIAVAFLESPEWSEVGVSPGSWTFAGVAALTRRGVRTGVYADVRFDTPVSLAGPADFIRCGQTETWEAKGEKLKLGGLRIWFLDGESDPYNVLPVNEYGDLPRLQEVQSFVLTPVKCPTG